MSRSSTKTAKPKGILWIGDPHVAARRPGSRIDDYAKAVLRKLAHAVKLADKNNWQVIITGDLFHRPVENDLGLLAELVRMFGAARYKPYCLVGNHDKRELKLTANTALSLMFDTGGLLPLREVMLELESGPQRVIGVDHGDPVPLSVPEGTILVTHHDYGFPDASYPGCVPPPEVNGALYVVNGHIHKASRPLKVGATLWFNPGNIARVSRAEQDNKPRVWSWEPGDTELTPHDLPHSAGAEVFEAIEEYEPACLESAALSAFAQLMRAESALDASATDDGSLIKSAIDETLLAAEATDLERAYVTHLFAAATAEN